MIVKMSVYCVHFREPRTILDMISNFFVVILKQTMIEVGKNVTSMNI